MRVGFIGIGASGITVADAVEAGMGERGWSAMADFTINSTKDRT